jgi:hypothetical protein
MTSNINAIKDLGSAYIGLYMATRRLHCSSVVEDMAWAARVGTTPRAKLNAFKHIRHSQAQGVVEAIKPQINTLAKAITNIVD